MVLKDILIIIVLKMFVCLYFVVVSNKICPSEECDECTEDMFENNDASVETVIVVMFAPHSGVI